MFHDAAKPKIGLTLTELDDLIARRMEQLDGLQEDQENLGPFGELLRSATQIAFHRAAELIDANNRRIAEQIAELLQTNSGD